MATTIAANAWIDPRAEIDDGASIGPFCLVGPGARIGRGTRLISHVTILGNVSLGCDNVLYPQVVVGGEPQDPNHPREDAPEDGRVEIGDGNTLREGVTVNRGGGPQRVTRIGCRNFLMANVHVAHDCRLGDQVLIANGSLLAAHVRVEDHAAISGGCAIHQFVSIGGYSFLGGLSRALHDVPPFMLCEGSPAHPRCINIVALKRHGFAGEAIDALAAAHRLLFRSKVGLSHAREILDGQRQLTPEVQRLLDFIGQQQQGRHGRGLEGRDVRRAA